MGWIYLVGAGLAEIGFSSFLKLSEGFTRTWPTVGFFLFSATSFWLLTRALQTIPVGTAYGVWAGIGALGTAVIGIIYFKDPVTFGRLFFLTLLLISIVGLKVVSAGDVAE